MDAQTLRLLEFAKVQEILSRYAASSPGRSEIAALSIQQERDRVRILLDSVSEMRTLLKTRGTPPLRGCEEIRPRLRRLEAEGGRIDPDLLVSVLNVIRAGQEFRRFLGRDAGQYPLIHQEAQRINPLEDLARKIAGTVDERGHIKDSASPELGKIRRRIRQQKRLIRERLETFLSSSSVKPVVQDRLVTLRNGRYVIPLKPDFSSKIEGIIQDRSASGLTVYVEPSETVKMNNHLSRLGSEEALEIRRVLSRLGDEVRSRNEILRENVSILARMDLHLSKALYAEDFDLVNPEILDQARVDFREARHPILLDRVRNDPAGKLVPVDLNVGKNFRTLVITGPNTGGKTVALKTLGLLVLMTQAGIPIPAAEGSSTGLFKTVFVDIGDEQSIEEDLSTFSGHIRNITRILKQAGPRTMVLLDELGTGTNPREGAALGTAVLDTLHRKGCLSVATTHYEEIKHYAYRREGMMNASVALDAESLAPTYLLQYGHLGRSRAFEVSERIGLPGEVLKLAESLFSESDRSIEKMIEELEGRIEQNRLLQREMRQKKREMEILRLREEREKEAQLSEARQILAEAVNTFKRAKKRSRQILKHAERAERSRVDREIADLEKELQTVKDLPGRVETVTPQNIRPGFHVSILGTGERGVVIEGPTKKGRVQVLCKGIRIEVPMERLQRISASPDPSRVVTLLDRKDRQEEENLPSINLVGLRVEEARKKTVAYIDNAHLNRLQRVEIIHGIGTGALREVVAEVLQSHPLVADFENSALSPDGGGVTRVELVS